MNLRSRHLAVLLFVSLFSLFLAGSVSAQTTAITYQGELNDGGTPAQGAHDFEFTLFDALAGGNVVESTVTVLAQPVSDGIFTVQIDFGEIAFENGDRWLEVGVRPAGVGNYQTLAPRQPLNPSPFAITAYRVLNGAIDNRSLANDSVSTIKIRDDAVTAAKIDDNAVGNRNMLDDAIDTAEIRNDAVTRVKIADGSVTGQQMTNSITVGSGSDSGTIIAWNGNDMQPGVELLGDSRRVLVYAPSGVPRASLDVPAGGRLLLNDAFDGAAIAIEADEGIQTVEQISLVGVIGSTEPFVEIKETGDGGQVNTRAGSGGGGVERTLLGSDAFGSVLTLMQDDGDTGVRARGDLGGNGYIQVNGQTADTRIVIDGEEVSGRNSINLIENNSVGTIIASSLGSVINDSLGVDRTAGANALEVEGNASKSSAGDWLANSDVRIKTDVSPIVGALETIDQVRPVTFRYTPEYLAQHPTLDDVEYYNVVAQDFQKVFPESVQEGGDTLPSGDRVLQVDTHPAMITAVAALKELHAIVRQQDARIAELENMLLSP